MNAEVPPRGSICHVDRGLYVFRYVEATSEPPPRVDIAVISGIVVAVPAPGRERTSLTGPEQALVLAIDAPSSFQIRVQSVGGGTDASFSIVSLDAGTAVRDQLIDAAQHRAQSQPDPDPPVQSCGGVSILAHVSRRGDVAVGADIWVAGPDEVLPIEGLAIATGRDDLGINIRVRSAQGGIAWSRPHHPGEFAGSRQRADALTGLALELIGTAAGQFEIRAEVMTLGSPPVTRTGRTVEFSGVDPIVGFRFGLNAARVSEDSTTQRQAPPVRVFRAKR